MKYFGNHGLRTLGKEIAFTTRPKIKSQSQIYKYGRSIFCLPHRRKISGFFDLCLHWVSVVRGGNYLNWLQIVAYNFQIQKRIHSGFLEHWNSQKSLCNIWQRFSCLLDEWIEKICKKNFLFMVAFFWNPLYPFWDAHGQAG